MTTCEYCNGTGRVPKGEFRKHWWLDGIGMSGREWAKTEMVKCSHCQQEK